MMPNIAQHDAAALEAAITTCRRTLPSGACLVAALSKHLNVDESSLAAQLRHAWGVDIANTADAVGSTPRLAKSLHSNARKHGVLPVQTVNGQRLLLMRDPWNVEASTWLSEVRADASPIAMVRATDLEEAFNKWQRADTASDSSPNQRRLANETAFAKSRQEAPSSSEIVNFVNQTMSDAWAAEASDIHYETGAAGLRVLFRVDGVLILTDHTLDSARAPEVISRIKVLAKLDITERRIPQDGRFRANIGDRPIDLRVSVMPCVYGEDAVLRLLDKAQLRAPGAEISLASLGFDVDTLSAIRRLAARPHGMLLVTGPTGSGKTTTLYAVLSELRTGQEKVVTIEDPVEYELPGVLQVPVDERKGLTFARGLRSILRHDPDKILIGEIRDAETAEIAIQSALTGHLVYTTVHANNVFDVIGRFVHMNVDLPSLLSALNGVIAQRLIRLVCTRCSEMRAVTGEELTLFKQAGIEPAPGRVAQATGCDECRRTGYRGRTAVGEALVLDDAFRQALIRRASFTELRQLASTRGVALETRTLLLAAEGKTTIEEVDRVVGIR